MKIPLKNCLLTAIFLFISFWLMNSTFEQTPSGNLRIAAKAWSDFGATLPLIRSFSYGDNFPVEYPIFPNRPIRYHFVFYFIVGMLEKIGIPLPLALNTLSAVGFFLLLTCIYLFGKIVFRSDWIGILASLLFLFNGSFGFINFFQSHPPSLRTVHDITTNTTFSSFGPYDGNIVSAFWSINIFTNQRHLSISYAAFLALLLSMYAFSFQPKKLTLLVVAVIGIIIGFFPFFHSAVFGMMSIALFLCALLYANLRWKLLLALAIAILMAVPQFLYVGPPEIKTPLFHLGYLLTDKTVPGFLIYWLYNLGLAVFIAPLGFWMANKSQKKILVPFIALFVIGNIMQFTPDVPTNHKFFNLTIIGANILVALVLVKFWKKNMLGKIAAILLIFPLTLTGVIDLFPILNDNSFVLEDVTNNKTANFIAENTPKNAIFLNSSYLYNPASIAGRKIFMGWPYFSWGAGYDTQKRDKIIKEIFEATDKGTACVLLKQNQIGYVEIQEPNQLIDVDINEELFKNEFVQIFNENGQNTSLYDVSASCPS